MNFKNLGIALSLMAALAISLPSCKSQEKKDAAAKAKIEATLTPGATVDVKDGVATINGTFADEATKTAAIESAKKVSDVKSVVDNSTLPAPVVIAPDEALTTAVNAAVAKYPGVNAQVMGGVVTLTGTTNRTDLQNLMQALNELHPSKVENKLTIK